MSGIVEKVKDAFVSVPHAAPKICHHKKILLCVTSATPQMPDHRSGYFLGELLHPYEVFSKHGWDCDIVSETGTAQPDEASLGEMAMPGDRKKWDDKSYHLHSKLAQLRAAGQVNAAEYAAIYFAGGHGACVDFPTATNLKALATRIYEAGGVVAADCHGPAIFDKLMLSNGQPMLKGKMATGFSTKGEQAMPGVFEWMKAQKMLTMQEVVQMNGGTWHEHSSNPMGEFVQVDDRIVTGMNPASAAPVAEQIVKLLPQEKDFEPVSAHGTSVTAAGMLEDKNRTSAQLEAHEREKQTQYTGERSAAI